MHPIAAAYIRLLYYGWKPENAEQAVISDNARAILCALGVDVMAMREVARSHINAISLAQVSVKH
jgi:hypothetical protein